MGFDRADEKHQVCLMQPDGSVVADLTIPNTPQGQSELLSTIAERVPDMGQVLVALEDPTGPFFEAFLNAGCTVYPVNPKALQRFRDRYQLSGNKTDLIDSRALADLLRKDRDAFRALRPDSELTRELRLLTRDAAELEKTQTMLSNQLRDALKLAFPVVITLFNSIAAPVCLAFLAQFPSLEAAREASIQDIWEVLHQAHQPQAMDRAREVHEALQGQQLFVDPVTARAKTEQVRTLVALLQTVHRQAVVYQRRIRVLFRQHPDREIFLSLPGAGDYLGARLAAEFGDHRDRFADYRGVAALSGVAPVTKRSGRSCLVLYRRGCCKSFRETMFLFAFCSLTRSTWASTYYRAKRTRGLKHPEAMRCLGMLWMRIIYAMWRDHQPYDEARYLAAREAVTA